MTFEDAIREERVYVEGGFYYKQLKRYLEYFSRKQILILLFDDIVSCPEEEIRKVLKFLNVSTDTNINLDMLQKKVNPSKKIKFGSVIPIMDFTHRLLIDLKLSFLPIFLRKIGVTPLIKNLNTVPFKYPDMNPDTRQYLRDTFKDDIRGLETLLNRDLSHWR